MYFLLKQHDLVTFDSEGSILSVVLWTERQFGLIRGAATYWNYWKFSDQFFGLVFLFTPTSTEEITTKDALFFQEVMGSLAKGFSCLTSIIS